MKKYVLIVAGVMLIAFISSCKKFDHILYIADNCPVISHSVSGGANYQNYYTYDKNGYMSSMSFTTTFMMGTDEIVMTNTYYYKRASNGTLTGMEVESTDNTGWYSKEPIKVTYDALGRIVKLTEYYAGEPSATHQLKYNSDGLLSEHLVDMSGMPVKYIYT